MSGDTVQPPAPVAPREPVVPGSPAVPGDTDAPSVPPEEHTDLDDLAELAFDDDPLPDPDGPAPRIVAFDIGEVLIDETRVWAVWAELLGTTPLTFAAVLGAAIAQGEDHHAVFPHLAPNIDWTALEDEHERRYGGFVEADLYADARLCLTELTTLGFRVVVVGNQPSRRAAQLEALDLPVERIVTSDELGVAKPDPAFFTAVLELAGTSDPTDVLYVGDRIDNDVLPASEAGLRTCWLRRGPWGHLQDVPEDVEPDLVLEGLGELPLLLGEWRGA